MEQLIVGGATEATIFTESYASGDITITQSDADVYTFSYAGERGVYSLSVGVGYAFGFSFDAYD